MKNIASRLNHARKELGLTYSKMAESIDIGGDALRIAISRNNVKPIYINILSHKLGINKNWLLN